ncbi:hypothetical protein Tco_0991355 [Tanacetum coccineum]|uniref:Uncharacterized protein n=1 Tax=Tanacetum coccineum TaxID=301880 RepID=A0ABQ5EZ09_9ASTR
MHPDALLIFILLNASQVPIHHQTLYRFPNRLPFLHQSASPTNSNSTGSLLYRDVALRRSRYENMSIIRIGRLSKMVVEVPDSSCLTRSITTCSYSTNIMKAQIHVSRLPLL